MTKLLEKLQKSLELRIKEELNNNMMDIDKDSKNTAKDFIKLILRIYPYLGFKDDINVSYIFNNASNAEIKSFIRNLKVKYNQDRFDANNILDSHQGGHNNIVIILQH